MDYTQAGYGKSMPKERKQLDLEFMVFNRYGVLLTFSEPISDILWQTPGAKVSKQYPNRVLLWNTWDWKSWIRLTFKNYAKNPQDYIYNIQYSKNLLYTASYHSTAERKAKKKRTNQFRKSLTSSFKEIPKTMEILGTFPKQ